MRLVPLALAILLAAGCDGGRPAAPAGGGASPDASAADPRTCAAAHRIINDATARFTAEVDRAMAAQDAGDTATRDASVDRLRRVFADWSAGLSSLSAQTGDPRVAAALAQYAGAVKAAIDGVHSAADLESLASFDDQPLDVAADKLEAVCP